MTQTEIEAINNYPPVNYDTDELSDSYSDSDYNE